jgi:hypothetical protein
MTAFLCLLKKHMRIHLFEFEDQKWFPDVIRKGMTDYLRYLLGNLLNFYKPIAPVIYEGLKHTGSHCIVDLASGGGGAIDQIRKEVSALAGASIPIIITDKYPNTQAYEYLKQRTGGEIDYISTSVDATNIPADLKGFRVMFSAFHHFKPEAAKAVLQNAVDHNAGIAIFDGGDKNMLTIIGITLFHPFAFLIHTPFFRPFTFSRIFFTYIIPLIPLCTIWDGAVSIMRLYTPKDLKRITAEINAPHYIWKTGRVKHRSGLHITYLMGYPRSTR